MLLILISVVAVIAVIVCILRCKTQKTTASPKQVKINQLKPVARPSGQNPVYEEIHRSDTSTYISHTDPSRFFVTQFHIVMQWGLVVMI